MYSHPRRFFAVAGYVLLCQLVCTGLVVAAELRVVNWNTAGGPHPGLSTVLAAIGEESVGGLARPLDLLVLQEQSTSGTTTAGIVTILEDLYGQGTYAAAPMMGQSSGAGLPAMVYRVDTLDLVGQTAFGEVNTSAQARSTLRYHLQPDGYDESFEFFVYSNHYKAGTGSSNEARRLVEAQALRADLDALGEGVSAILAGDFNIRGSDEPMYVELTKPGPGQAFDPIGTPGDWHNSQQLRHTHTQTPTSAGLGSFTGGGIDDRFDFQLVTGELLDGQGLDILPSSYRAFGNNGTHICCNSDISSGSGASPSVLAALETASDHLPIVADFFLPPLGILGDFNGDLIVDAADYTTWRDGLGDQFTLDDYALWAGNFGAGTGASGQLASIPEPGSLLLMLTIALAALLRRSNS